MLAADTIAGVNTLLWRHNDGNFLHLWSLDSNWNWASSGSVTGLDSSTAWSWEEQFQVDANRDGLIGAPIYPAT
jgi:hypothetical protein